MSQLLKSGQVAPDPRRGGTDAMQLGFGDAWSLPDDDQQQQQQQADTAMGSNDGSDAGSDEDAQESRAATHRAHIPFFYETMVSRRLDAPATSVHFMPELFDKGDTLTHRLAVSTSGARNQHYICFYKAQLPCRRDPQWLFKVNEETGEIGGRCVGPNIRLEVEYRMYHAGAVCALEQWACNPCFISTRSEGTSDVMVFNTARQKVARKRPEDPDPKDLEISDTDVRHKKARKAAAVSALEKIQEWNSHTGVCEPNAVLTGLSSTGDSLDVAPTPEGHVAAGSLSGELGVWRLSDAGRTTAGKVGPLSLYRSIPTLDGEVCTARFSPQSPEVLLAGGDGGGGGGGAVAFVDIRSGSRKPLAAAPFLQSKVLSADWSLHLPAVVAVGDASGCVSVMDIRNTSRPVASLQGHASNVFSVKWCPHQPSMLASGSSDSNVCLWDVRGRDAGCHPAATTGSPAPPQELYFTHTGHRNEVGAVAWCRSEALRGVVASVDIDPEEPELQIWRPRNNFIPDP